MSIGLIILMARRKNDNILFNIFAPIVGKKYLDES